LLVGRGDESHIFDALVCLGTETDRVLRSIAPDVATAIAYLTESLRLLLEKCRFFVLEVVRSRARRALRSLYPEPRTTCVEDQLVRFLLASKVHRRKNLDVKEVGQVFLQEPLTVFWGSVSLAIIVEGEWKVEFVSRFNVNVKL